MVTTAFDYTTWEPEFPAGEYYTFVPCAYTRPSGGERTVFGGTHAVLVFDGNPFGLAAADGAYRVGGDKAIGPAAFDAVVDRSRCELAGRTTVEALVAAVGPPVSLMVPAPGAERDCEECHGRGEVTCYACDHDRNCEECDGTGKVADEDEMWPDLSLIEIARCQLDRRIIANLLPGVPAGPCDVFLATDNASRVDFVGQGWRLVVMGMDKADGQPTPVPFALEAV